MTSPPVRIKISEIAKLLGWTRATTHYWIGKAGVPVRWDLGIMYVKEQDLAETLQALREARQAGLEARQAYNRDWTRRMALKRSQGTSNG